LSIKILEKIHITQHRRSLYYSNVLETVIVTTAQLLYRKPTYSTVVIVTLLHSDAKRHNYCHLYFTLYGMAMPISTACTTL